MNPPVHVQVRLSHTLDSVFRAVTDAGALTAWFTEHADVSVQEKRYDFWGRFTPECPDREHGRHLIENVASGSRLRYAWSLRDTQTAVEMRFVERSEHTYVGVWHHDVPESLRGNPDSYAIEDFWFLTLENLRRQLAGRRPVRCDFSAFRPGDIRHTIEIDGPAAAVWEALITPKQLDRWIASRATVDLRVGGEWDLGWMENAGLEILSLTPGRELSVSWKMEGVPPTVLTWTLEESGGKTRLSLVHSGFAPDARVDGMQAGWLNFMSWLRSVVEFGPEWMPVLKEIPIAASAYYAASIWEHQDELISREDSLWD